MQFPKATAWTKELFASLIEGVDCEPRSMFGYPCAFLNGNMFSGVFGNSLFVRLGEKERAELLAISGAQVLDPMGGRPMKEYVQFPDEMLEDEEALRAWVRRSRVYAGTLPAKKPKSRKKPAPAARRRR